MEWQKQKLIDITSFFEDGNWIESKDQSPSGFWLVQTGNVGVVSFRDKEVKRFVSENTFKRLNCTEIYEGDILVSRLPEPVGRACIVPKTSHRMLTAVDCSIVRLKDSYDTRYINYALNSGLVREQVYKMVTGSSRKRISRTNLGKVEVLIPFKDGKPDRAEQKRIADKLDKIFSETERGIETTSKQGSKVVSFKRALLAEIFSNSGWGKVILESHFDIAWGNTSITKKSYVSSGHMAYSAAGADGFLKHYEHEEEGIILSAIGARCGKCFLANGKWTAIKNTIVMLQKSDKLIDNKYAWYFLNDEKKWRSKGAGQPFITQRRAMDMELPVPFDGDKPDIIEQKQVVRELDTTFSSLERLANLLKRQQELFVALRASALNQAFQSE